MNLKIPLAGGQAGEAPEPQKPMGSRSREGGRETCFGDGEAIVAEKRGESKESLTRGLRGWGYSSDDRVLA